MEVDAKLKELFPKLENSGGYSLMKTQERGSRALVQLQGPYSVELLKQATGQGKIYIKPLQCDLCMDEVEKANNVVSKLKENNNSGGSRVGGEETLGPDSDIRGWTVVVEKHFWLLNLKLTGLWAPQASPPDPPL